MQRLWRRGAVLGRTWGLETSVLARPLSVATASDGGALDQVVADKQQTKLKAVYASRKLDTLALHQRLQQGILNAEEEYLLVPLPSNLPVLLASNSFAGPASSEQQSSHRRRVLPHQRASSTSPGEDESLESRHHCAYFPYGALVFFNCDEKAETACLELAQPFAKNTFQDPETEDYLIEVDPNLSTYSSFSSNRLILRQLDAKSVGVIASVLAQAVALRHFENEIDTMLEHFEQKEGGQREAVKILQQSNKVLWDVMLNLGLLDQASESSPAWQDERYYRIWTGLREEFEIEKRWRALQTKANFLQDNLRFAVELTHARTSERLEVFIIVLIGAELLISLINFVR